MSDTRERGSLAAIANIEHDFRQPLQAMALLQAALALRGLAAQDREIVANMGHAVDAMTEMVEALMTVAKLDAGMLEPHLSAVSLSGVLAETAASIRERANRRNIEIRTVPAAASLYSDGALLGRLLRALVSNAVAFTESGRILLGVRHRGPMLRIEVWDTGCGIPAGAADRIFERFHTDDPGVHGRSPHLGLGLSVARGLAALLGHELTMRSWPGKGSVFALTGLAVAPNLSTPADAETDLARRGAVQGRVIICAGDWGELDPVVTLFERWHARIVRVDGPESLVDALTGRRAAPCLAVLGAGAQTDVSALLDAIAGSGADVPFVIIAGKSAPDIDDRIDNSETHVIRAPVNPGRLRALVEHLIARPAGRD